MKELTSFGFHVKQSQVLYVVIEGLAPAQKYGMLGVSRELKIHPYRVTPNLDGHKPSTNGGLTYLIGVSIPQIWHQRK